MRPRDNPFRSECIERLPYQLTGCSWDELLLRFEQNGFRGAVIGPHGTGKTTLLAELLTRLERSGHQIEKFVFRDEQSRNPCVRRILERGDARTVVIDGYEQLSLSDRMRLRIRGRKFAGFLVTSHRQCGLPVLFETSADLRTTQTLVELLHPQLPVPDPALQKLLSRYGGDVREAFRALYDQQQQSGCIDLRETHS